MPTLSWQYLPMAGSREKSAALAAAGTAAAAAAGLGIKRLRDGHGKTFDSDAYRLLAGEPVGAGVRRILAAQVTDLKGRVGAALLPTIVRLATYANNTLLPAIGRIGPVFRDIGARAVQLA